ncbi:hypothetical protein SeMB42_g02840 [Synchytrium endobioticum]|uniref:Piwi domain-containing protein n=1 Tax=Synchytrium endobioticum TaxID=286115 RepID=A0A507DD92_9FUNG|nr:hypothetical protein SeLEV6574_g05839 [Synchytrium endobioticum]TPX48828.1 hypothetical protein SeMB42_g02840 [Synchytrium endobioticum]
MSRNPDNDRRYNNSSSSSSSQRDRPSPYDRNDSRGRGYQGDDRNRPYPSDDRSAHGGYQNRRGGPPPHFTGRRGDYGGARSYGGAPGGGNPAAPLPVVLVDSTHLQAPGAYAAPSPQGGSRQLCLRPDYGSAGRKIRITSNFFQMTFPQILVYQYDLDMTIMVNDAPLKKVIIRGTKRLVFEAWKAKASKEATEEGHPEMIPVINNAIYDGEKNWYTVKPLFDKREFLVEMVDPESGLKNQYRLRAQQTTHVDMSILNNYLNYKGQGPLPEIPRVAFAVLEILIRHQPSLLFNTIGRNSYYLKELPGKSIKDGLCVHLGWFQSVRAAQGQLMLNLDVSATAMYEETTVDNLLAHFFQRASLVPLWNQLNERDKRNAAKFVTKLKTTTTYKTKSERQVSYRIAGIDNVPAVARRLENDDGSNRDETVAQYYLRVYDIKLKYPELPCAVIGGKRSQYLPLELLLVKPGQRFINQVKPEQLAEMIKSTSTTPADRFQRIIEGAKHLHGKEATADMLKNWEVNIDPRLVQVNGRVLNPPRLYTLDKRNEPLDLPIRDGGWHCNSFCKPAPEELECWAILSVESLARDRDYHAVEDFSKALVDVLVKNGVSVKNRKPEIVDGSQRRRNFPEMIRDAEARALGSGGRGPAQLLVIVIDKKNSSYYGEIKHVCETQLGIMTACVALPNLQKDPRGLSAYVQNVSLKINQKLGGSNVYAGNFDWAQTVPTMMIGADVYHPPPGSSALSIAAVVASMDKQFTRYIAATRSQQNRMETIKDIRGVMVDLLEAFKQRTKVYPQRLIFFRDGVSEGQYDMAMIEEVGGIQGAFRQLGISITLTFIVVTKRHHGRFFPADRSDGDRKNGNCTPGTTIDSTVTHPFRYDYYQYGANGLLGTSRPAHYTILYDEHQMNADMIQQLTLSLCHVYGRCSRSISLPAPVMFAHLAAGRGKHHMAGASMDDSVSTSASGQELRKIKSHIEKEMYFV